jgi:glycosyltransferase involved in cell wall biosynthesis
MRILQVIGSLRAENGGPSLAANELNAAWNRAGHDATLFTIRGLHDAPIGPVPDVAEFAGSGPQSLWYSRELSRALSTASNPGTVIYVHGLYLGVNVSAFQVARRHNVVLAIQPHGTLEPFQRHHHRGRKFLFDSVYGNRTLRAAKLFVCASQSEADHIRDHVKQANCVVSPLGVRPAPTSEAAGLSLPAGWLDAPRHERVVFLGRLARKKNIPLLLEAWRDVSATLPTARLLIAGPDHELTAEDVKKLISSRGLSASVSQLGMVAGGDKWDLLRAAGIFALPSSNENFAIAVLEALATGCDVLTTEQVAASEYVMRYDAGIVLSEPTAEKIRRGLDSLLRRSGDVSAQARDERASRLTGAMSWDQTASRIAAALALIDGVDA